MSRSCVITDDQLVSFADGETSEIEDHIFTCEECQADLALLWDDLLEVNVAEPVLRAIRIDWLVSGMLSTGVGVASRITSAAVHYLTGRTGT